MLYAQSLIIISVGLKELCISVKKVYEDVKDWEITRFGAIMYCLVFVFGVVNFEVILILKEKLSILFQYTVVYLWKFWNLHELAGYVDT